MAVVGLVALIGVVLMAGCGASNDSAPPVAVSETDSGGQVTLGQGQELRVQLEGNPTTGFTWEVRDMPAALELRGEPQYVSGGTALGAGGAYVFAFTATEAGAGRLVLIYHRTFETGVPPAQTFTLDVTVE